MSDIEVFGETMRRLISEIAVSNKNTIKSNAVFAILNATEFTINAVVEKHERRGDAWEDTFSNLTCFNLAGAKIKRVEMLIDMLAQSNQTPDDFTNRSEIVKEMVEESSDAIAYIAFGMWNIG